MPNTGSFAQLRLDLLDPRHGQPGGIAGEAPLYEDGSVDEGRAWSHVLGSAQDAEMSKLRVAALSRLPQYAPADALDPLGAGGFVLPRMPGQGDDSYRATLENAFPIYSIGGSAQAVIDALVAYGFVNVVVLPIWESPAPLAPETSTTSYSMFYVFLVFDHQAGGVLGFGTTGIKPLILGSDLAPNHWDLPSPWVLGATDGASTLGSSATRDQIVAAKRLILRWKATHGYPIKVVFDFGDGLADSTTSYPIGRTLGSTWPTLGDVGCILGGYQI